MLRYWIWLSTRKHINDQKKVELLEYFGTPDSVYTADEYALKKVDGLSRTAVRELMDKDLAETEYILRECDNKRISILTYGDAVYPSRLKAIADPPLVLYYQGRIPNVDSSAVIGMVGTRRSSGYGMKNAKELAYQLGKGGAVVVSGIAEGIDTMCLEGALTAGSPVISVLGNGMDVIYPKQNRKLYEDVRSNGCLLTEFIPGTPPMKENFPKRNRIISGLALGVVVVEAPQRSGALITARRALDQGRDVFTIPANLGVDSCKGNMSLLKQGAILIENGADVLQEYCEQFPVSTKVYSADFQVEVPEKVYAPPKENLHTAPAADKKFVDKASSSNYIFLEDILPQVSEDGAAILNALRDGTKHVDELVEATGMSASKVSMSMTVLEIKKFVKRQPGMRFSLPEHIKAGEHHE